jgi:hypothetical protein
MRAPEPWCSFRGRDMNKSDVLLFSRFAQPTVISAREEATGIYER